MEKCVQLLAQDQTALDTVQDPRTKELFYNLISC